MGRLNRRWIGLCAAVALPLPVSAQIFEATSNPQTTDASHATDVGGTPSLDMITLRAVGPGAPLRFGNVIPGSERVQLDGQILQPDADYSMDYGTGVVYLKRAQRAGQVLTVYYRYRAGAAATDSSTPSGINGFKFSLMPGNLTVLMGLGITERATDGSVISSNTLGWRDGFNLGARSKLGGLFVMGDRQKNNVQSGLSLDPNAQNGAAAPDSGHSQFLVQQFETSLLGGGAKFDYQDISKNFASFGTVADAGYSSDDLKRYQAEKGLTRFGMALDNLRFGSLALSDDYKVVRDGKGSIAWRSMGLATKGVKLNWDSQSVDKSFTRFADISEANKAQLQQEAGMNRDNLTGEFDQKMSKLSFALNTIADSGTGAEIRRRDVTLDTSKIKFDLGDQSVDQTFGRMGNLLGPEKALYGREAGLHRQWMSMQSSILGAKSPITFAQNLVDSPTGKFGSQDVSVKANTWSLEHISRNVSPGFTSLSALQEPEIANNLSTIARMYGPNVPVGGNDRNEFFGGVGLDREFTHFTTSAFKGWNADFSDLKLKGRQDGGFVDTISLQSKHSSFELRREELGPRFNELTSMMDLEKQRLGTVAGLDRSDLSFNSQFGDKKLAILRSTATADGGDMSRTSVSLSGKTFDMSLGARDVSAAFGVSSQLVDPEKALLATLQGFNEHDAKLKWQILPNLKIDTYLMQAMNATTGELRKTQNVTLDWAPTKSTQFSYSQLEQKNDDPINILFANLTQRMSLSENFGKYGTLQLLDERQQFDGTNAQALSFHKESFAYEAKLSKNTSVRTEQSRTSFDNGDKEDVSANTISTELTKRTGVSVTDTKIDRTGEDADEVHRNYGFWFDLGNGVRVSYGYARQLTGQDASTLASTFTVGKNADPNLAPDKSGTVQPGQVGNLVLGGGYGVNQWETGPGTRTQSFGTVAVSSAKAFQLGPVRDVKFDFALDTAADYSNWLKENRVFDFSGKLGANTFGFDYKGQMDPNGQRAIDRTFRFETDKADSKMLKASVMYKMRTLPLDNQVMIRNFSVTARPTKNFELTNEVVTNPELPNASVLLGTVPQAASSNKWRLDYKRGDDFSIGGSWEELINDQAHTKTVTGGINMKLFGKSGSPLQLFYGLEQNEAPGSGQTTQRYHLQFDQRPGPNQTLSIFLGNVSYEHSISDQLQKDNWMARLDYQFRF